MKYSLVMEAPVLTNYDPEVVSGVLHIGCPPWFLQDMKEIFAGIMQQLVHTGVRSL